MKIGLETESCHLLFQHGRMNIFGFIEFTAKFGLDGVQINIIPDYNLHPRWGALQGASMEYLSRVKAAIDQHNLYCEIATRGSTLNELAPALRIARALGVGLVRSYLWFPHGRFDVDFMASQISEVRRVVPFLKKHQIRLAFENHEFETSAELIKFISLVGQPEWVGLLCDTGNSMMAWEEPLSAIRAMAPHAFGVHFKDHSVIRDGDESVVCGMPLGRGNIDIDKAFRILVENSTVPHINLGMCYPYCATFKREPGTGGSSDFAGAFAITHPPFPPNLVRPMGYYYPHDTSEEALLTLLECQQKDLEHSIAVLTKLRDKYCSPQARNR
jgi:sugar phosphate isomerase/epimerase